MVLWFRGIARGLGAARGLGTARGVDCPRSLGALRGLGAARGLGTARGFAAWRGRGIGAGLAATRARDETRRVAPAVVLLALGGFLGARAPDPTFGASFGAGAALAVEIGFGVEL